MYYEHKRHWFVKSEDIPRVLEIISQKYGTPEKDRRTVTYIKKGILYVQSDRGTFLHIKSNIYSRAYIDDHIDILKDNCIDDLKETSELPELIKDMHKWPVPLNEGSEFYICLDVYGEDVFAKLRAVEKSEDCCESDNFVKFEIEGVLVKEVTGIQQFDDESIAIALKAEDGDYGVIVTTFQKLVEEM